MRTRRPPAWWAAILVLLLVLWVGVTFYYRRGASGVGFGGSAGGGGAISFDRQNDVALFQIDERVALAVMPGGPASVVKYGRGMFPFCPLCGTYELQGSVVNLAGYYRNGWIYTDHPGPFAELYHVASGETVDVARPAGAPGSPDSIDVGGLPDYAKRGLTLEPAHRLTPERIGELFRPLAGINESCVVFNAAFLLLTAAWLAVALVIAVRGRRVA